MRREPLKYLLIAVISIAVIIEVMLLLSGRRVLLNEEYLPELPHIIGSAIVPEDPRFECTYFTGRKQVTETLPADQFDECPFIWTEG